MAEAILKISVCFMENLMIFIFLTALLKSRFSGIIPIIAGVGLNFEVLLICFDFDISLKTVIMILSLSVTAFIIYSDKLSVKFAYVLISLYIPVISDIIFEHIFNIVNLPIREFEYELICAAVIIAVKALFYLLVFRMLRHADKNAGNKFWGLFSGVMILFLIGAGFFSRVYQIVLNISDGSLMYTIDVALFFFMSFIIIYLFAEINKGFERDSKLFLLENNYNFLQQQIAMQQQSNELIKKIRHDMKNNLINIRILINSGEISDAKELLDKAADNVNLADAGKIISSKNSFIDAIILSKIAVCKEKEIDFTYSIEPVEGLKIDVIDITSLLSNLLDNAIEAAENTPLPFIRLTILKYNAYYTICTENSYKGKEFIKTSSGMLASTKSDKAFHGYGTQIISDIAKKYDGNYSWEAREDKFVASVIIKA